MARLSTHVLDTSRGIPAQGVVIELHRLQPTPRLLQAVTTNADGRTNEPLTSGDRIEPGLYQLHFHVADYFRANNVVLSNPPFLDVVIIQFAISQPEANYHVPLLVSPYGYCTYRGS